MAAPETLKEQKIDIEKILEVVIGREEAQIENDEVKTVKKQKTPTKIKKVESFLEFANFY